MMRHASLSSRTRRRWRPAALQSRSGGLRRRRRSRAATRPICACRSELPDLLHPRLDAAGRFRASSSAGGCASGRRPERLPIIMLTARGEESRAGARPLDRRRRLCRQAVLDAGADGPRRGDAAAGQAGEDRRRVCDAGDIELDRETHRVRRGRPRDPASGRPNSACSSSSCSRRAGCSPASSCSTASGAATSMSTSAPSTSMSAACARRINRGRQRGSDPHRARRRLCARREFQRSQERQGKGRELSGLFLPESCHRSSTVAERSGAPAAKARSRGDGSIADRALRQFRSSRRSTFPTADFGNSSRNSIVRGRL